MSRFIFFFAFLKYKSPPSFALLIHRILSHSFVNKEVNQMMKSFRYDAHPMGMLVSTIAAVSTFHPESNPALAGQNIYDDRKMRNKQIHRIMGNVPTIAANCYRHRIGRNFNIPH
jgi:citrate synthase